MAVAPSGFADRNEPLKMDGLSPHGKSLSSIKVPVLTNRMVGEALDYLARKGALDCRKALGL